MSNINKGVDNLNGFLKSFDENPLGNVVSESRATVDFILIKNKLKEHVLNGDYYAFISLFLDYTQNNLNPKIADSFVTLVLDHIEKTITNLDRLKNTDQKTNELEESIVQIIRLIGSKKFFPLLTQISPENLGNILKLYTSYGESGVNLKDISSQSNITGIEYILSSFVIPKNEAFEIISLLSKYNKDFQLSFEDTHFHGDTRFEAMKILLNKFKLDESDVNSLILMQVENFGHIFYWMIVNYYDKINRAGCIGQIRKVLNNPNNYDIDQDGREHEIERIETMLEILESWPLEQIQSIFPQFKLN